MTTLLVAIFFSSKSILLALPAFFFSELSSSHLQLVLAIASVSTLTTDGSLLFKHLGYAGFRFYVDLTFSPATCSSKYYLNQVGQVNPAGDMASGVESAEGNLQSLATTTVVSGRRKEGRAFGTFDGQKTLYTSSSWVGKTLFN